MSTHETWFCAECGSLDIQHDAIATWNPEKEDWDVVTVLDNHWCEDCMLNDPKHENEGSPAWGTPP